MKVSQLKLQNMMNHHEFATQDHGSERIVWRWQMLEVQFWDSSQNVQNNLSGAGGSNSEMFSFLDLEANI